MTEHRFKIGQIVYFHPKKSRMQSTAPSVAYQITKRMPAADGEYQYAIKSMHEQHDRVASESELTPG